MGKYIALAAKAAFVFSLFGCLSTSISGESNVYGVNLPRGMVGDTVTIIGQNLNTGGTPSITIGGQPCAVVSYDNSSVVITVPAGAATGEMRFINADKNLIVGKFYVGTTASVPEVEPNDAINGADATLEAGNRSCTGNLSSVGDKDHFRFEELVLGKRYRLKVNPRIVGSVYVHGAAVSLDSSGEAEVIATSTTLLVGLTGGTGDYTLTATYVP